MNTERENNHGEHWEKEGIYMSFNMKKLFTWILSFFLMLGICQADSGWISAYPNYCGSDTLLSYSAKQTLSNVLIRSQELDVVAGYTLNATTITADNAIAPDGTLTAERVTASAGAAQHNITATTVTNRPLSAGAGTRYRSTAFIKAGTWQYVAMGDNGDDLTRTFTIDLSNCSVGANTNSLSVTSYLANNGYCRIDVIGQRTDVCGGCKNLAWTMWFVTNASSAGASSYTASGTETVFVWGVQQNVATTAPADYLATTATALTLGPLCPSGTSQSYIDPTKCYAVTNSRFRVW